ncbi:hypothetical protein [Bacillus sp. SM2101]|uniref:hypothetical protein n=1 Tax=Bacillus sp. SM2101 TaxID=2805366 RepID=UPI001BDEC921|nr:hypothetical protein [Bacillus sp. SM2101]
MENKKYFLYLLYVLIFSSSIVWSAHIVSYSTQRDDPEKEEYSDLLTQSELLEYLHISEDELKDIIIADTVLKRQLTSYDTYRFLPYIEIADKKMFLMNEIKEWLKYQNNRN